MIPKLARLSSAMRASWDTLLTNWPWLPPAKRPSRSTKAPVPVDGSHRLAGVMPPTGRPTTWVVPFEEAMTIVAEVWTMPAGASDFGWQAEPSRQGWHFGSPGGQRPGGGAAVDQNSGMSGE